MNPFLFFFLIARPTRHDASSRIGHLNRLGLCFALLFQHLSSSSMQLWRWNKKRPFFHICISQYQKNVFLSSLVAHEMFRNFEETSPLVFSFFNAQDFCRCCRCRRYASLFSRIEEATFEFSSLWLFICLFVCRLALAANIAGPPSSSSLALSASSEESAHRRSMSLLFLYIYRYKTKGSFIISEVGVRRPTDWLGRPRKRREGKGERP